MPTAKDAITINLLDATSAMPVSTYGEVIVIGPSDDATKYNIATQYSSQAGVEVDFDPSGNIALATAMVFAQGVPHVKVMNVYKDAGTPKDYATCLAKLETDQVDYDIMVPVVNVADSDHALMRTHAITYKKVMLCPMINTTAADAVTAMDLLTKDETQYAIVTDSSGNTVGELAGMAGGVVSKAKPWIPVEWQSVTGINAAGYSPTDLGTLETDRINAVITVGTATVLSSGMALKSGTWLDIFRTKQYLKDLIFSELVNLKLKLANMNQKIPYDVMGLKMVQGTLERCCRLAQAAGALRADYVNSNGDLVKGYSVFVPAYEDISDSDKAARLLQNVTVTSYLAGAVSKITLDLVVTL